MPWEASDAHRFKKGLSDEEARQWAHVANSALMSCMDEGGMMEDCEGSAIRQANGVAGKEVEHMMVEMEDDEEEEKEPETKAVWDSAYVSALPNSAFLFVEPGCEGSGCRHLPYKNSEGAVDMPHLRNALSRLGQSETGKDWKGFNRETVRARAEKILSSHGGGEEPDKKTLIETITEAVTKAINNIFGNQHGSSTLEEVATTGGVWLYKDQGDTLNWVARYSNIFRDDDWPVREIIASDSHRKFNALVNHGVVPPPDLWIWHEPSWKIGKGLWHAYDELGFAIAGGTVLPGAEEVVVALAQKDDGRVSHGMPRRYISRLADDNSIIAEHITEEVSWLPGWAAANKLTGFGTYEEKEMAISQEDKKKLIEQYGVSKDLLDRLEAANVADATKAMSEARDSKEVETPAPPAPVVETEVVTVPAAPDAEVTKAMTDVLEALFHIGNEIKSIKAEVAALKVSDAEKVAKQASQTSLASMSELMKQTIVGNDGARVDGRTSLAKEGPVETKPAPTQTVFGVPTFLDEWAYPARGGNDGN